jgi:glycosyltransferase involved in cell wall biosynthesis
MLRTAGFDVTIIADGPRPRWLPFAGQYIDRSSFPIRLPGQDLVIGTYWTTLAVAEQLQLGPVAHFCQGYEGRFSHLRPQWPEIEAVYRSARPLLTVTPHLGEYLGQRFDKAWRLATPVLDPLFHPLRHRRPRRRPWIAVAGVFEADMKDLPTALETVRQLRASSVPCRLLRMSALPLTDREHALLPADRFLHQIDPQTVAHELRRCDLLLFSSRPEDGFGLPLLEAMASGVPAVSSRIPSTELMAGDALPLVPAGDVAAFVHAARELLTDRQRWRETRRRGIVAAHRLTPRRVTPQLISAIQWAAGNGSSTT